MPCTITSIAKRMKIPYKRTKNGILIKRENYAEFHELALAVMLTPNTDPNPMLNRNPHWGFSCFSGIHVYERLRGFPRFSFFPKTFTQLLST